MNKSSEASSQQKLDYLIKSVETIHPPIRDLMLRSFIQGVFVGLGTTVGVSIVIALLTFVLTQLHFIPGLNTLIDKSNVQQYLVK